eukprot:TRINITY_DN11849_c0_g1_i1.p1 TRINITY_DN11849_c0_g1~~TRINITY_DN11849_c0_g1_i1.p1  ORF type:complete len:303 (+),score=78.48 TRINITY_DN11849_c0_g1_i1:52-960(+)
MDVVAVLPGNIETVIGIDAKDTVRILRAKIERECHVSCFDMCFNGKKLTDLNEPLSGLGLVDGDRINLEYDSVLRRKGLIQGAKIADNAERYEDAMVFLQEAIRIDPKLNRMERDMLSTTFRQTVSRKRDAWKMVKNEVENGANDARAFITEYLGKIENEVKTICCEVIELVTELENHLEPTNSIDSLFYKKMKADYHRYHAEVSKDQGHIDAARTLYTEGLAGAAALRPTDPLALGIALNVSVFHNDILGDTTEAIRISKESFDNAICQLDTLDDENYKDATLIMQLLRDNITLWSHDVEE